MLTREEILNEPAGRKLDAWVAEKVMELTREDVVYPDETNKFPHYTSGYEYDCVMIHELTDGGGISSYTFEPSSSIQSALYVVEKLQESHLYTDIRTCADFYEVWTTIHENGRQTETIAHPSLPLAICRAALLAVIES